MSQKNREKVAAGPAPTAADPSCIRNVALVGHSGVGKTTLAEALLAAEGVVEHPGDVAEGTTVCDHDPAAVAQQRSVGVSCAPFLHRGIKINLIDTPGYADFVGELRAGLRAADAALFVVSAVNGLDAATQQLWQECAAIQLPRAVAVTRLDHPEADFDETLALCQRMFGDSVLPAYLPLHDDDGASVVGLIGLVTQRVFDYKQGHPPTVFPPAPEHRDAVAAARGELLEGVIAESEDETLMERYLAGEEIDADTVVDDLETAVARGTFHPVVPVNAVTTVGLDAVLELICGGFPPPTQRQIPTVTHVDGEPAAPLRCDPDGPLAAEVVKTSVDPYLGRVSLVRVFSGTLRPDRTYHVSGHGMADRGRPDHDADERVSHVYTPLGANLRAVGECVAGDICAITKSGSAQTGDTISPKANPLLIEHWSAPEPLYPVAVVAASRFDDDALAKNLARLTATDSTLRVERNSETGQVVLWCMGQAHAEVVLSRLRAGGATVDVEPVRIALRETFAGSAKGLGRHVKQSGGHGQYAVCHIDVEPLTRGSGFEFTDKIVGGAIPQQFVASVEKGVKAQLERGLDAGLPIVDVGVTVYDGKTHSVDSSDAAFQSAGALALRAAAAEAGLTLLEPVDEVVVTVAAGYVGPVLGDLSSRRGRVLGTQTDEHDRAVIHAEIPAAELVRYTVELRAITAGSGTFTRTFARHEPAPAHLAAQLKHAETDAK